MSYYGPSGGGGGGGDGPGYNWREDSRASSTGGRGDRRENDDDRRSLSSGGGGGRATSRGRGNYSSRGSYREDERYSDHRRGSDGRGGSNYGAWDDRRSSHGGDERQRSSSAPRGGYYGGRGDGYGAQQGRSYNDQDRRSSSDYYGNGYRNHNDGGYDRSRSDSGTRPPRSPDQHHRSRSYDDSSSSSRHRGGRDQPRRGNGGYEDRQYQHQQQQQQQQRRQPSTPDHNGGGRSYNNDRAGGRNEDSRRGNDDEAGGRDGYSPRDQPTGRYDERGRDNAYARSNNGPGRDGGYGRDRGYGQNGRGGYGDRDGARGGGRGFDRGGHGRGGGGGGGGGRGGRGGGGRGGNHIASNPTSALSNLIMADTTANFKFYQYGVEVADGSGRQVDSRRVRQTLFFRAFFGPGGLFERQGLVNKERDDIGRVIFFEGSHFYAARKVPGLDHDALPIQLVGGDSPVPSEEGDVTFRVTKVSAFTSPAILRRQSASSSENGDEEPNMDLRCMDCTRAFANADSLLSHAEQTGHRPASNFIEDDNEDAKPAQREIFVAYANVALQRALGERMAKWGREYIDPKSFTEPTDRRGSSLGVKVFKAYTCELGLCKPNGSESEPKLTLTVDLRAKVLRTKSLLDQLCEGRDPNSVRWDRNRIDQAKREWIGEVVICTYDKRCYSVIDLIFEESPASMPLGGGNEMSHADYFEKKKNIPLRFPDAVPLVAVLGRNNQKIYLPAEVVAGNELDRNVKTQLPMIASFKPNERHAAIEEMRRFLVPGGQKTKGAGGGLLPAIGIVLKEDRIQVPVNCLTLPRIISASVPIQRGNNWAPELKKANFNVRPGNANELNVVLVYHRELGRCYNEVYDRLAQMVNDFNASFRFPNRPYACVEAGDVDRHWEAVERYFTGGHVPDNTFVIDFNKPPRRAATDPAYPVVKKMLGAAGHLSQFVNFNNCNHGDRGNRKSATILGGVARQILSKCGVRIWWVDVPRSLPLPAVFVGVDVFHAPRKYNPETGMRTAKESCAAVVVTLIESHDADQNKSVKIFSQTERRDSGKEVELGSLVKKSLANALQKFDVSPASCIIWRDGIGEGAIRQVTDREIPDIRSVLANAGRGHPREVSLAYLVAQKRIAMKFLTPDGRQGMPAGALIEKMDTLEHECFYINGTSPPYSTPKPVRFIIAEKDRGLDNVSLPELSWALSHDYANWTGPIKMPAVVQYAHKLAELAGGFDDCGDSINAMRFANTMHFL